jgi:hypothetical protein
MQMNAVFDREPESEEKFKTDYLLLKTRSSRGKWLWAAGFAATAVAALLLAWWLTR